VTTYDTKSVQDITDTLIDYRGKTPPKTTSGMKLITAKVIKNGFIADNDHEYIAIDEYERWMRRGMPKQWDILITTEAPLGEVAQIRTEEKIALAQRVILLRGNSTLVNQSYLFHALKSPMVQAGLRARSSGTTVLGIKQSELLQVRIPCPPLRVQDKIANLLSPYDSLIENNTHRIKILEEMAKMLYREWFVNFRFPGHEKVKMMNSEIGVIPAGWSPSSIGFLSEEVRRSVQPENLDSETPYIGLEHMPRQSIALLEWGVVGEVQSTKLRFHKGEILFGKIRPYFHKVGVAPLDGVCSSDAIVIRPKKPEWHSLVLCCVSSKEFVSQATQTSQGTKMPRANWAVLTRYPVALPNEKLLTRFNEIIRPAIDLIQNLVFCDRNLRQTRNLLLPKLISGEISVEHLESEAVEQIS
jgi:type I restriction enzyme S subunit